MPQEGFKRKPTPILNADIEGYGRLMDDNEESTTPTLITNRKTITDFVLQFCCRVVDTPGDNASQSSPL
jgi:hypothetical protein